VTEPDTLMSSPTDSPFLTMKSLFVATVHSPH
jgi:hypothetical protein